MPSGHPEQLMVLISDLVKALLDERKAFAKRSSEREV